MAYGHFRCIRFKRKNVVGETGIGAFLDRYISLKAHGVDLDRTGSQNCHMLPISGMVAAEQWRAAGLWISCPKNPANEIVGTRQADGKDNRYDRRADR